MSTSDNIMDAIEQIASFPKKGDKESAIILHMGDEKFVRVISWGLDPFVTFGVRPLRIKGEGSKTFESDNEHVWKLLDDLRTRTLTGNDARDAISNTMRGLTEKSAELLWRIINKDFRAGFGDSTINKVAKGTLPEFPYQRCSLPKDAKMDEWEWEKGVVSQEKADGMFTNINHEEGGVVSITSRQGSPLPIEKFPQIVSEIVARLKPGTQTHGEMLVECNGEILPREIGNGVLNSVIQGGDFEEGQRPILKVWDQIPLEAVVPKGKCEIPYRVRLANIVQQLKSALGTAISIIETKIVRSIKEAKEHYRSLLRQGKEGTIVKKLTAIWRDGTSKEQVKFKLEAQCELEIVGFRPGEPGKKTEATFGALVCRSACGLLEVGISGMKDALRLEIHNNREEWLGRIITVTSNSIMEPTEEGGLYSLYLGRFTEVRHDKSEADTLERIRAQFENAVEGA